MESSEKIHRENINNSFNNTYNNNKFNQTSLEINHQKNSPSFKLLADDLKSKNIWAYGVGHFMNDICASIWFFFLPYYLIQIIGLEEHNASYVLLCGQVADALATPLVGVLSDRWSTRFGKRFPWYFGGTLLAFCSFALLFYCVLPPNPSETTKVIYYSTFGALFNIGWAAVQVSHMALLPSITLDTRKKDLMTKIRTGFTFLAQTLTLVFSFFYFSYIKNKIFQYEALAGCCLIIGLLSSMYFMLYCKEWVLSKNIPKYFDNILILMGKRPRNNVEEKKNECNNNLNFDKNEKEEEEKLNFKNTANVYLGLNKNQFNYEEKRIESNNVINLKTEDGFNYKKLEDDENAIIYKNEKVKNDININSIPIKIENQALDLNKKNLVKNLNNNDKKSKKFEESKNSEIILEEETYGTDGTKNNVNYHQENFKNNNINNKSNAESNNLNATKFTGKALYQEDNENHDFNNNTNCSNNYNRTISFIKNNNISNNDNNNNIGNDSLEYESNNVLKNFEANYDIKEEMNKMNNYNNDNCNYKDNEYNPHEKKHKRSINWLYWLKKPDFYYYIFVYMFVRLSINITSIVIPFYMEFVLKYQKTSEGGTPYEITICLLISTVGSIFNSIYLQKFFEVETTTSDKNLEQNKDNQNYNFYSNMHQIETNNLLTSQNLLANKKREMETAKRNKRLYLILVSLFFISIGCLPLFILNPSVKNSIFFLSFLWGIGFSQALSCVSSLTNDVVGKNGSKGAFVYGAFSFADKLSCGIVLVFYLPMANKSEYNLRNSIPFFPPAAVFFGTLFIFVKIFFDNKKLKEDSQIGFDASYEQLKDEDFSSDEISIENFDENEGEEIEFYSDELSKDANNVSIDSKASKKEKGKRNFE